MRGLKQTSAVLEKSMKVASFTDAWIETFTGYAEDGYPMSHLLQMRGLKLTKSLTRLKGQKSHLLQMRGLKQYLRKRSLSSYVASFTDAWIETISILDKRLVTESHLLQMRGLKPIKNLVSRNIRSRIFYRCVD